METKFRAFDPGTDEWLYFSLNDLIIGEASYNTRLKHWCLWTGLKDKNGKDVYFGDITVYKTINSNWIHEVNEIIVAHWIIDEDKMNQPMKHEEVIGNIFENPELLRK